MSIIRPETIYVIAGITIRASEINAYIWKEVVCMEKVSLKSIDIMKAIIRKMVSLEDSCHIYYNSPNAKYRSFIIKDVKWDFIVASRAMLLRIPTSKGHRYFVFESSLWN